MDIFSISFYFILGIFEFSRLICAMYISSDEPRQKIDATGLGLKFEGNTSVPDHFKLLERDGDFLLIGARDVVYNISVKTFAVHTAISWRSSEEDVQLCLMKGKSKADCHNFVRILAKQHDNDLLICGTNSYKPLCRQYQYRDEGYVDRKEFSGSGACPYDPAHNSTAFYLSEKNELYAGTVADFVGADPLVSNRKIDDPDDIGLRTERSDSRCLNDPNFVSSFADKDHVYFWFREGAVEHTNCGKAVHSRVSRVCKNDKGGKVNSDTWTTFLKASLNCSIPGDYPFYFDEIEATSSIVNSKVNGRENLDLVYAVFSTPYNSIRASAVCAFSMEKIRNIFSNSAYKAQASPNSNWLPIFRSQVPQPRPGDCDSDSRLLSEEAVNFVKKNPLMDEQVPNVFDAPLLVHFGLQQAARFTQIVVDAQVPSVSAGIQKYDVIFVGTDNGHVIKLVNVGGKSKSVHVETIKIFADGSPVINMLIYKPNLHTDDNLENSQSRLIVVGDEIIKSLPLHYCEKRTTCSQCVKLQDPYCAWDTVAEKCVGRSDNGNWPEGKYTQNIIDGSPVGFCDNERIDFHETKNTDTTKGATDDFYDAVDSKKQIDNTLNDSPLDRIPTKNKTASCNCLQDGTTFSADEKAEYAALAVAEQSSAVGSLQEPQAYSSKTPVQYTAGVYYGIIAAVASFSLVVGVVLGYCVIPKLVKRKRLTKGRVKVSDQSVTPAAKVHDHITDPVVPNGSVPKSLNGHRSLSTQGSLTPLNSVKSARFNDHVTINLKSDDGDSSISARNSPVKAAPLAPYSSYTLPNRARQTYL